MNELPGTTVKPSPTASGPVTEAPPLCGRRLLVVDDEEVIRQIVQGFLGVEGWEVDSVSGTEDAFAHFADRRYPVVLCDVHLPGDSTDLLRRLKAHSPATQVIMFTGDPTVSTVREALQHGAYEYVPKPCRREELVHIVQRAYEKYTLLCEQTRLQAENELYRRHLEELVEKRSAQLRESELRYRAIFNRAVDAIFLVDLATGEICDHNIAATRLLDLRGVKLTDRPMSDFVGDQLVTVLREAAAEGHREWRFERVSFSAGQNSPRIAQVSVGKVEFDHQTCLQIVARDVTAQIELAERTEIMENELLSEQRLAAIGLLASGIAHNINTPLMGIYGSAQLIKMKHPDFRDIDGVITQVERVNAIVRNLMWKSRQEQDTSYQEIDLNQLLQEELRFLEADMEFKHNVEKQFHFADNVPAIVGRYSDFSQSIMNVVRNALDSMHAVEHKVLRVTTEVHGDDLRLSVVDNGCGIATDNRDKLFVPFYTTKPLAGRDGGQPSGTGLGLSTVQRLLTPYGVRFAIDSEPGHGTSFTFCIPIEANSDFTKCSNPGMNMG
jgi:PAS domain S-box-containing protein